MSGLRKPDHDAGLHGLRKHAGGALNGINTHATGSDDALTPSNIGAATPPVFRATRALAQPVTNGTETAIVTITPAAGKTLIVFALKMRCNRSPIGANSGDTAGRIRLTYSDATTAATPLGTSGATPGVVIPSWHDRSGNTAFSTQGLTENLDATTDFVATFSPNGKSIVKIEFLAARVVISGTGDSPTVDCMFAGLEL